MSEDIIEDIVEKRMDVLDKKFMRGDISQDDYDLEVIRLARWAQQEYELGTHVKTI